MRRKLVAAALIVSGLAALYFLGGYVSARLAWVPAEMADESSLAADSIPSAPQAAIALAVHTARSHDALGSDEEVVRAARDVGIDVVLITDHRSRESPDSLWDRQAEFRDGVLLVRGQELSLGPDVGRLLVFGLDTTVHSWDAGLDALARKLARDSSFAIVAHSRSPRIRDSWRPERLPGIGAWEVLDFADIGRKRLKGPWVFYHLMALAASAPIGRLHHSLARLHREGFAQPAAAAFDSIAARRPITAVAGLDVHPKRRLLGQLLPAYDPFFRAMANHISLDEPLPSDAAEASKAVLAGLASGRVYISLFGPGAAGGFTYVALGPSAGVVATMGGATALNEAVRLHAGFSSEEKSRRLLYRLVRDGATYRWSHGPQLSVTADSPGVYRVEVYRYGFRIGSLTWNLRPWVFSNPIRLVTPERRSTGETS